MNHTRRRRAASAVRASLWTRLRQRLFRRRRPKTIAVPTTWLIERKRELIGADLEQDLDISKQETQPLPCICAAWPAYEYWFYDDETVAVPTK